MMLLSGPVEATFRITLELTKKTEDDVAITLADLSLPEDICIARYYSGTVGASHGRPAGKVQRAS